PEHAALRDSGRAEYASATDEEALQAFRDLTRLEGIIPALEPAHALARARELEEELVLVCLSGRGEKDLAEVLERGAGRIPRRLASPATRFPTYSASTTCWCAHRLTRISTPWRRRSSIRWWGAKRGP